MNHRDNQGFSLLETLLALFLVIMAMMAGLIYVSTAMQGTRTNQDKDFAIQKAISILEELKAVVEISEGESASILDDFDDGALTYPLLTVDQAITSPDEPASGNISNGAFWKFERQITVQKFPSLQTNDVRLVNVKIFGREPGKRTLLAEVSSVIRTVGDSFPPSQVYDVYCLGIENVPGWWVYMANLVPFVERAIQDLESRNPGLEFRTHWVRTLSYGRDGEYVPHTNEAASSTDDEDRVYFYPGTLPTGSAVSKYYVPRYFSSKINIDGTVLNGYDATTNPVPYSLADQYNHAMRYPQELALFNSRVVAGLEDAETPTLRLLLEEMYSNPERFENAILINLHGELFPFPPLRNYSDAAKDPESRPNIRVVTHPERLRFTNGDDVGFRVYSYLADPADSALPDALSEPITVLFRGLTSLPGLQVSAVEGGLDTSPVDGSPDSYAWETTDDSASYTGDMYYAVEVVSEGTLVRLYNSPLRSPCADAACSTGGLKPEKRLYGLEYVPTPLSDGGSDFSLDLQDPGDRVKNTARWRIQLAAADLPSDTMLTVETRIGNDRTTGVLHPVRNEPRNRSVTYAWRGSDNWIFGDGTAANVPHLPLTERFQVNGDPRHNPYADLKQPHSAGNPLGMGYNRYFDDFHNAGGNKASDPDYWPGFTGIKNDADPSNDGWYTNQEYLELDVNRINQILRSSLLRSKAVWTTLTGFSYYYVGTGGEIGYDTANGFPNSIPVSSKPFSGVSGTRQEQTILDDTIGTLKGGIKYIRENEGGDYWWGINWLGELYPDSSASDWVADGNLPTGVGAGRFVRTLRENIDVNLPTGTTLLNSDRRLRPKGCTGFFSVGSANSTFHHKGSDGTGTLVGDGLEIAANFNFNIPSQVPINRPFNFDVDEDFHLPDNFQEATYDTAGLTISTLAEYYDHSDSTLMGSSALELRGSGNDISFIVVNGVAQSLFTGSAFIGKWSFLTLTQSFLNAGLSTSPSRISQLPRVWLTEPNLLTDLVNPSSITIEWEREWKRWDGLDYTTNYPSGFTETTPLSYAVMYSDDSGRTWRYVQDDSLAVPGQRPSSSYLQSSTNFTLSTPADKFPKASYVLRVEAYRDDIAQHFSFHQVRIYIKR